MMIYVALAAFPFAIWHLANLALDLLGWPR